MRTPVAKGAVVGVVAAAVLVTLCAACPLSNTLILRPLLAQVDPRYVSSDVPPTPFDAKRWRSGTGNQKVAMARWLEQTAAFEGKSREELVELLGEPEVERPGDEGVRWLLGFYAKGLFDESKWLVVTIEEDGKATGASGLTGTTHVGNLCCKTSWGSRELS